MKTSDSKMRCVVADDDSSMCSAICEALRSEWPKAEITIALNGQEAIDLLGDARQQFDLLVTDLVMPGQDGFAVIGFCREVSPHTRIVAMTGDFGMSRTFALAQAVCSGAHAVLSKPFVTRELRDAILQATWTLGRGANACVAQS